MGVCTWSRARNLYASSIKTGLVTRLEKLKPVPEDKLHLVGVFPPLLIRCSDKRRELLIF